MKNFDITILDNLDFRKFYVETDGQRYSSDGVFINYEKKDYNQQNKDRKVFFKNTLENNYQNLLYHFQKRKRNTPSKQ